jgi:hypothetical protein
LNLFPNPTDNLINVNYVLAESGQVDMVVTDIQGRLIDRRTMVQSEGQQNIGYDVSTLEPGTYLITLITGKGNTSRRFVVFR